MQTKSLIRTASATLAFLLVPLVAMQFTDEVDWNVNDFVIMGLLVFVTGLAIEYSLRNVDKKHRLVAVAAIIALFFLIWAELAVGIFGTPFAGS